MNDISVLVQAGVAIALVIVLIMWPKIDPAISLLVGSIYLGLVSGGGFTDTAESIAAGFGDVMVSVGLIIGLGILLGSLLVSIGTVQGIVEKLLRWLQPRHMPYATGLAMTTLFPVIYADVLLVLTAPLAHSLSPRLGKAGKAKMSVALSMGIGIGLVFVVPGAGAVAISGLLDIPMGLMFVAGIIVALPTLLLVMIVMNSLINRHFWNSAKDEVSSDYAMDSVKARSSDHAETSASIGNASNLESCGDRQSPTNNDHEPDELKKALPIEVSILPIVLVIVLIASAVVTDIAGLDVPVLAFLGQPTIAILAALILAYLLAWGKISKHDADRVMGKGFSQTGTVLILTGAGGSFGAVIEQSGLERILSGFFSTNAIAPLILVWLVGAVLVLALGSPTVALLTAGGILAPVMTGLDISPIFVALAAAAGSLFAVHVNANYFWMFKSLMGLSTRGTLKTLTLPGAVASVISMVVIIGAQTATSLT